MSSGRSVERDGLERVDDPAQLDVPPLEVPRQAVVALGEAAELVVARELQGRPEVAGRDPVDRAGDRAQRRREVRGDRRAEQHGEHDRDRDPEQEHAKDRGIRVRGAGDEQDDDPEAGEREHRGRHQSERQAGPEPHPGGPIGGRGGPAHRDRRVVRRGVGDAPGRGGHASTGWPALTSR